jgi:hypothetical protein
MKKPIKIPSYEELTKKPDLHPCPCDRACNCAMEESCLGCETYAKWLKGKE